MANQPIVTELNEVDELIDLEVSPPAAPIIKSQPRQITEVVRVEKRVGFLAQIDRPLLLVVLMLVAVGCMMVYSTTFDWSYQEYGSESVIFMQHVRNLLIGMAGLIVLTIIDYRLWKRLAVLMLMLTIGGLIAVLLFGDGTFGARRAFIQGSYQPGELAELIIVVYMAAWLGSKNTRITSITYGLIPFAILLAIVGLPIILQPDISTAATIFITAGIMFFLAGANIAHLIGVLGLMGTASWFIVTNVSYAGNRLSSYIASLTDITQADHHAQQAMIAFYNGGWFGVGLGQGRQKFPGFLPVPHTDSIFAVIGEELGVIGAVFVVMLYVILVIRGLSVARKADNAFGALLASGVTLWIATKALMNIAVMLNLLPSTGVALPFISYGGSSLVTVLAGAGLLLSISRVTTRRTLAASERKKGDGQRADRGWGNRGTRLSGAGNQRGRA
jgi:cell division protein FtsW